MNVRCNRAERSKSPRGILRDRILANRWVCAEVPWESPRHEPFVVHGTLKGGGTFAGQLGIIMPLARGDSTTQRVTWNHSVQQC